MLYQRIRPTSLDEIVGQEAAVLALDKAVKSEDHAHVYLFRGPAGCGKTTLARILAEAFGCNAMNIIEKNAANERGIDMVRQLERDMPLVPMGGGKRMVILDEAHMLTREAANALLKILEDIPAHQYYCLCSTDPEKILKTIRTRCDQVEVKPLRPPDMERLIFGACERAELDDPADEVLRAIVKAAEGCPRTALVLTEKQDGLDDDDALRVVEGFRSYEKQVIDLCRAIVNKHPWPSLCKTYKAVTEAEPDAEKIRRAILGYLHTCLAGGKDAERFSGMIDEFWENTFDTGKSGLLSEIFRATRV